MALSDEQLRRKLTGQEWTSHNIRLSPEITTMPGQPDFIETNTRLDSILRALPFFYRDGLKGLRVADLGCLEGGFALAMARRGMNVIGIEARQTNLAKAFLLKEHFELPNLEFRQDDVKNFTRESYGTFDIVLALGILYHLDEPLKWMRQLAGATDGLLIVDSHFAPAQDSGLALLDPRIAQLGPLLQIEDAGMTYEGRWFTDCSAEVDRETQVWASYSNNKSFWLTKDSLCCGLRRAGFNLVFEQHDAWGDLAVYKSFSTGYVRAMFIAIKSNAFPSRES
jgi:SAM-dependent methyltransferase